MSDLIARMEQHAGSDDGISPFTADGDLIREAIAEIGWLRAALTEAYDDLRHNLPSEAERKIKAALSDKRKCRGYYDDQH